MDALLQGGRALYPDVEHRLQKRLKDHKIEHPSRWCEQGADKLDRALAETVTIAANEVLLDSLLEQLTVQPLAKQLLFGTAVYRKPVDELGLIWQIGEEQQMIEVDLH